MLFDSFLRSLPYLMACGFCASPVSFGFTGAAITVTEGFLLELTVGWGVMP